MKKYLKIIAGAFGAFYSVAKDLILWIKEKQFMDLSQIDKTWGQT